MYSAQNILYFDPYYFEEGGSKKKYFLVIKDVDEDIIVASLPTKQDHIPDSISKENTGCINNEETQINCFFFKAGDIVSECGKFGFPLNTYVYGETVKILSKAKLKSIYTKEDIDYQILGKLKDDVYEQVVECFKESSRVKRGVKKLL